MKTTFLLSAFLLLFCQYSFGQADYAVGPVGSQMKMVCLSGTNTSITVQAVIEDKGSNGDDTDYLWFAPGGGLALSGTLTGVVTDGTTEVVGITVAPAGGTVAGNMFILRCQATHNGGMDPVDLDFLVTINDQPSPTTIATPDGTESCDGIKIELVAQLPAGVTAGYSWNTGETSSSIFTNTAGTYSVTTSNACGTGFASQAITEEVTPAISTTTCTNANNQLTFEVSASDNDNAGITFTFHEDDPANPPLTNGGDYSITTTATTATLIVSNVNPNHQGVNFYAKATNSCGEAITLACLALPIELEYFTGRYTGEAVVLDWATATETDNDYFSIERSTDGLNFKEIERIEGAGTSYFTLKYSYTDEEAPLYKQVGTLYYRLKQTDYNGSFSYSDVLAVQLGDAQAFEIDRITLSASQELQFSLQSARAAEAQISLYRMDGSRLLTQPIALRKGVQSYTVALSAELASGLYLLRVESGAQTAVKKFSLSR